MIAAVSQEALRMVKHALSMFSAEMSGIASNAERSANEMLISARMKLNKAAGEIEACEHKVQKLSDEIARLDHEIPWKEGKYKECLDKISQLSNEIDALRGQIGSVRSQISGMRNQAGDEQGQARIARAVSAMENQAAQLEQQCMNMEQQRSGEMARKPVLYAELQKLKNRKMVRINEENQERAKLSGLRNREERLKSAFRRMEEDMREYVSAAKNFEYASDSAARRNLNAVDRCIYSIEKYLNTLL